MNTFANPFIASNPFGFSNLFATPASFGSCGTGFFPGVNGQSFQNAWNSPVGQWINTGPATPGFGYANAPTGWTNGVTPRFNTTNGFVNTNTLNGFNPYTTTGMNNGAFPGFFNGFSPINAWTPSFNSWNTPFGWNTNGQFNSFYGAPSFQNPGMFNAFNPFMGTNTWTNPMFTNSYGATAWNGLFNSPLSTNNPWMSWTNNTPWNWNTNSPFGGPTMWNTTPSFFGGSPFGFFGNTPSFTPAFFSNVNPNGFTNQNIPTNNPYYNGTPNAQNTNGNPFQTGMPNQNNNPGLCRDAA